MSAVCEKRVALIGAGREGHAFARSLAEIGELSLGAVVDPDLTRARRLAGSAAAFGTVRALLAATPVPDIAVLCTPPALHLELGTPLLCAGADLLVVPPLATTPRDAERLTELAERLGRALLSRSALGESARRAGLERALAHLGRLERVEIELGCKRAAGSHWRGDPALSGGGVLMDLGPTALELAELLAGPLEQIRTCGLDRLQGSEVEDAVEIETAHASGAIASIHLTWNDSPRGPIARCRAAGGELVLGAVPDVPSSSAEIGSVHVPLQMDPSRVALLGALLERRRSRDPICDEGAQTLGWLHAAYRSRELGRWQYA